MSEETIPDGLLLRRYRENRDEDAFTELRRRYGRLVLATCRRETEDSALGEDAAQGVFLLLMRKSFEDQMSLAGWLHGASRLISRNLIRDERRRQRRERRAFVEVSEPQEAWGAVSPHIDAALAHLREGDREAVLLRFACDQSLAEVGRSLGIGENAARMRVTRALERMRSHLQRAGVGVGVLLLASLLSTRLAHAERLSTDAPSERARRLAHSSAGFGSVPIAAGSIALLIVCVGTVVRSLTQEPRLTSVEAARLFTATQGDWQGTLEFADDRTAVRTTTPVTADVRYQKGELRLTARYPNYRNVDVTTIVPQRDGRYRIENGGPGSSHRLDGSYELIRQRDGTPAFVGDSPAARGTIRLTLHTSADSLLLKEERRRVDRFEFRNRFELKRR